jgi:predicted GNAT family acetyltransferase
VALLAGEFAWLRDALEPWGPVAAVIVEGRAVSVCFSARLTPRAAEAGVETLPDFRGAGHATHAVAAWAQAIRESGRRPLYSTSWENLASQGVARRLGLRMYGVDLSLE